MKYTSSEINQMSWSQWNDAMARELNNAGFKARGYNDKIGKWEDNYTAYEADPNEPKLFILGTVDGAKEINYLKEIGLLNNGRCPMCGKPIYGTPGRFTSGFDRDCHFQICQECAKHGRRTSVNPANNTGCLLAFVLFPWNLIKALFC